MSHVLALLTNTSQATGQPAGGALSGAAQGVPQMGVAAFLHMLDVTIAGNAAARQESEPGAHAPGQELLPGLVSALAMEARLQRFPTEPALEDGSGDAEIEEERAAPHDTSDGETETAQAREQAEAAPAPHVVADDEGEMAPETLPLAGDGAPSDVSDPPDTEDTLLAALAGAGTTVADAREARADTVANTARVERAPGGERPDRSSAPRDAAGNAADGDETTEERPANRSPDRDVTLRPDRSAPGENGPRERQQPAPAQPEVISTALSAMQEIGTDESGRPRFALPASSAPIAYAADSSPAPGATAMRTAVPAVALEIASQARNGTRHFEIRLDPPELGRIEVRLDFARDGNMTTKLIVERPETLDLLMRDARALEKTLQSSGVKIEDGSVQYQLRDQSAFGREGQPRSGGSDRGLASDERRDEEADSHSEAHPLPWRSMNLTGVDMRI